jgi:outer membrane protein
MRLSIIGALLLSLTSTSAFADNLLDIYELAKTKDPVLLQAQAKRDSAFEAINQTQAANLPQLNLSGNAYYQKTNKDDLNTAFVAGGEISLHQAIWRHSNFVNTSIAEKIAASADLSLNDTKQTLILRTATAYFGVLEARDVLEFAKANQAALLRQYNESNQSFKVGLIANTDVQEAKAAYDQSCAAVIIAENALENSYENLREITGINHRKLSALDITKFSTPGVKKDSAYWLKTAEENNIALQSKMIEKAVSKDKISLAQTGHEPTLDLFGSVGTTYTDYKENNISKEDGSITAGTIGVELNLPLYSGGATSSAVEQAKLDYIAATESLELAHRQVKTDLYNQYNNINASIGTVKAYQQNVISAQSALEATEAGYQVGTRTIVDVLDATQKLYNAKSNLASARYTYIMSWLKLRYTTGLLNEEDVKKINEGLETEAK